MERGLVQIYTGDGKGKTTAALGLAFRALGRGWPVKMVQFLKGLGAGEHLLAPQVGLEIFYVPSDLPPWEASQEELAAATAVQLRRAWDFARTMERGLLILDEALGALHRGLLREQDLLELIDQRCPGLELVITGRGATEGLIAKAQLVTEMKKIRHPLDQGIPAREGVEF